MCGIIGYIGHQHAALILKDGLRALEYRGYDSAGIAIAHEGTIEMRKVVGRVSALSIEGMSGTVGIGHTRWATHGVPNEQNAHPHADCHGRIALVHNGVIENYLPLKHRLQGEGHRFTSDTDTEVIAHLLEQRTGDFLSTLANTIEQLQGSFALVILLRDERRLYFARRYNPLVVGKGKGEYFLASDVPALLPHTKVVIFLEDNDYGFVDERGVTIYNRGKPVQRKSTTISWTVEMAQKSGYPHFTIKEIYEQPRAILDTLADITEKKVSFFEQYDSLHVVGCGTAFYAGMVFKYLMQKHVGIPVETILANEYSASHTPITKHTLVFAISQSGETADTLSALRYAKEKGAATAALVNVVGSSMTRLVDRVLYTHAGPEISVVSTKAFSAQVAALSKIAFLLGKRADLLSLLEGNLIRAVEESLAKEEEMKALAQRLKHHQNFFFIGRGIGYPIALEGALKLKEISYLHAEGYPAGELKHGPLSILEKDFPVFAIAPEGEQYEKTVSNIRECHAREAFVIVLTNRSLNGNDRLYEVRLPMIPEELCVIPSIIPLQLFAYHQALLHGRDPDKPRNLAKSVTVE